MYVALASMHPQLLMLFGFLLPIYFEVIEELLNFFFRLQFASSISSMQIGDPWIHLQPF